MDINRDTPLPTAEQNKLGLRLIMLFVMLSPLMGYYPAYSNNGFPGTFSAPFNLFLKGEAKSALIKTCDTRKVLIGTKHKISGKRRYRDIYAPIAETSEGETAKGGYILNSWQSNKESKANCEATIGREVPVRIHPTDSAKSNIATLVHLWYPAIQILLGFFWIIFAKRSRVLGGAILTINFILIPYLFYAEYIALW